jgi:hypothetical protein
VKALRERYGASPLHLLLVLCSFALALYAGLRLLKGDTVAVAVWFVAAALVHDLVLLPLYTVTDRALQLLLPGRDGSPVSGAGGGLVNYVRVPGSVSLLLLVVWYPLILRRVPGFGPTTGLAADTFLGHWLLITAGLFAASALCLLVSTVRDGRQRLRQRRRQRRRQTRPRARTG